jgi:hypothetical protein
MMKSARSQGRWLGLAGSQVRALAAHPGYSATNLQNNNATLALRLFGRTVNRFYSQDADTGALPTLYAAVQDLPGASYLGPDGPGERRGSPALVGRSAAASDPDSARRLWTLSEELTGVTFPERLRAAATVA